MAQVPYSGGVPEVAPETRAPDNFQRISTNADQFGGAIARGAEKLGAGLEKASDNVFNIKSFQDTIDRDDQVNGFIAYKDKLIWGDPSKPALDASGMPVIGPDGKPTPDRGFMGLTGRAASDRRESILKEMEDRRAEGSRNLKSDTARRAYDDQTLRMVSNTAHEIGRHSGTQWDHWAHGVNATGADLALNDFVRNVSANNTEGMKNSGRDYLGFMVQAAQIKYGDDPTVKKDAIATAERNLLKTRVDLVAVNNPLAAREILDNHKEIAGTLYDEMSAKIRGRADHQAKEDAVEWLQQYPLDEQERLLRARVGPSATGGDIDQAAKAISSIESGGKYDKLGPITRAGDRAYGKYQVMGVNVGPWTQEILGRRMTVDEFLRSSEAQETVFRGKFGQYVEKYGAEGAARAWFAGEGGMNNPSAKDTLGTTVAEYGRRFSAVYGGGGGGERTPIDTIPAADRRTLLNQVQTSIARDKTQASTQRGEEYERSIIDFKAGLGPPLMPRSQIEEDPTLNDVKRNTVLNQYDSAMKDQKLYQSALSRFLSGASFNPYDSDERKGVDILYKNFGATPKALMQVVDTTGVMPKSAAVDLRGGLVSRDPGAVETSLQMVTNLQSRNDHIFAGVDGQKELETAAGTFRHYVEDLGFDAKTATQKYLQMHSPEYKSTIKAKIKAEDVPELIKKNLDPTDLKSAFGETKLFGWNIPGTRPDVEFSPEARDLAFKSYSELFKEFYVDNGDVNLSKTLAQDQLKKTWGVSYVTGKTGGTVTRYPPERAPAYANIPDVSKRIADQAISAIKAERGDDVDRSKIILAPTLGGQTSQAYQTGQPVPYSLGWFDKKGVLQTLNPGRAFVPDPTTMREAVSEERRLGLERLKPSDVDRSIGAGPYP